MFFWYLNLTQPPGTTTSNHRRIQSSLDTVKLVLCDLPKGHFRQVVIKDRCNWYEIHCEGKLKLRSHNTSYCLIEVVTKAGLTVIINNDRELCQIYKSNVKKSTHF